MNQPPQLRQASIRRRAAALMYEAVLTFAVVFVAAYPFIAIAGDTPSGSLRVVFYLYVILVCGAYFVFCWVRSGQTLAQKTWHIRLETRDGSLLNRRRASFRYLLALASVGSGLGLLWAFFDPETQFLHDRLSGTRQVYTGPGLPRKQTGTP